MPVEMSHETYGTRTVADDRVAQYERRGWTAGREVADPVVDASVQDVLARVGDDPGLAGEALAAERARSKPRQKLVASLERVIEAATTPSEEGK